MDDARLRGTPEAEPDFKARIDKVFSTEIEPYLTAFLADEAEQKKQVRKFRAWVMVPLVVLLTGAVANLALGDTENSFFPVALIFLLCGGLVVAAVARPAPKQRPDLKHLVTQPICRLVGDMEYSAQPVDEIDPLEFLDLGVTPSFDAWHAQHLFVGRHRGTEFRVCEVRLIGHSGHQQIHDTTMFKGRLFDIDVPRTFACRILVVGDRGALRNWLGAMLREKFTGMVRVETKHPEFEARYEVFTDAPDEADTLLTSSFLAAMVDLAEAANEKAINAAFVDGRLLLALPRQRSLFDIGEESPPLQQMRHIFERLVHEFTMPHRVIDFLQGGRAPRL